MSEQREAGYSNFSGSSLVFNQNLKDGGKRGLWDKKNSRTERATIQVTVKNYKSTEQIYELFNSNNSIAIQPDNSLYTGRPADGGAWQPFDAGGVFNQFDAPTVLAEDLAAYNRGGDLILMDAGGALTDAIFALQNRESLAVINPVAVKVSLKSTLGGNTYRRLVEKMRTSVIHVASWKIQSSNENQFQLSIAQKDFSITGASADDEYQVSASVSSRDNNTKIVEVGDKMLLIDGDTRLSGIILPNTTMVFTFEIDIINEVTKRVF